MSNRINRTRQKRREVCLTEEENELLKKRINDSPYDNFQNYARHMLLAGAIHYVDYSELQQLKWEVNKIGNNINQMAKLANQFEEISQEDIDDLLDLIHQVEWMVSNKLKDEILKERKTNGIHETF